MKATLLIVGIAFGMNAGVVFAHDDNMSGHNKTPVGRAPSEKMTVELKKDMADMYQKMATCMRTDKSLSQCSQEAMRSCPVVQKTGHCPINEGVGPMMGSQPKDPPASTGMSNMKHGRSNMGSDDPPKNDEKAGKEPDKKPAQSK